MSRYTETAQSYRHSMHAWMHACHVSFTYCALTRQTKAQLTHNRAMHIQASQSGHMWMWAVVHCRYLGEGGMEFGPKLADPPQHSRQRHTVLNRPGQRGLQAVSQSLKESCHQGHVCAAPPCITTAATLTFVSWVCRLCHTGWKMCTTQIFWLVGLFCQR